MMSGSNLLRIGVLVGAVAFGAASATSNASKNLRPAPDAVREDRVHEEKPVPGIAVVVSPKGAAAWDFSVANNTDDAATIIWDESSFVDGQGHSAGRLVTGETRRMDLHRPQPNEPIAPHSNASEMVLAEKLADAESQLADVKLHSDAFGGLPPDQIAALEETESARRRMLSGGKFYLVIQMADGKHTWSGVIVDAQLNRTGTFDEEGHWNDDPAFAHAYWCSAAGRCSSIAHRCGDNCERRRDVFCSKDANGNFVCATTLEQCSSDAHASSVVDACEARVAAKWRE